MKCLGLEFKGSTCIGILTESSKSGFKVIPADLKIELADSYNNASVVSFSESFKSFVSRTNPDKVMIKKRQEKGKFAGGAVSFKMEGLVQICCSDITAFVSGAQLSSFTKKLSNIPEVKKYQLQALFCSLYGLEK